MLTSLEKEKIEENFNKALELSQVVKENILNELKNCNEEEAFYLKYLYAYMPLTDIADYPPSLYMKFVRHSLKVRELMPWGSSIKEIDFLNYVLQYRINNENIEYFCDIFFEELYPLIKDLSMYEAIIEVNYWAFSKATYKASDDRTASPLTVVRMAYGRCGEESTFLVAALRSVCLPARQCYAPRWAHCDDNHAWVEVQADGKWNFLGACEPEIKLNRGWFRLPASKALLIHNRVFSNIVGDEVITKQNDFVTEVNILHNYAKTKEISVKVLDVKGKPMVNVNVNFEVVNYCEFFPITKLKTDSEGIVKFVTGLGDLFLFVYSQDNYAYKKIDARVDENIEIVLGDLKEETETFDLILVPPKGEIDAEEEFTEEEQKLQSERNEKALNKRKSFEETFYDKEKAKKYATKFNSMQDKIEEIITLARGNYKEIEKFLEEDKSEEIFKYKVKMLLALREKDLSDILYETLVKHFNESIKFKDKYEENIFVENVLNPRIWNENITLFKKELNEILNENEKSLIIKNPENVKDIVESKVSIYTQQEYTNLTTSPVGAIKLGLVNEVSKNILTVAILRSFGIASKMNKANGNVEFFDGSTWKKVYNERQREVKKGKLVLSRPDNESFEYYKNFTIGKLEDGSYKTYDLDHISWPDKDIEYELEEGNYRIVTANRRTDEANLIRIFFAKVKENEVTKLSISVPSIVHELKEVEVLDRELFNINDEKTSLLNAIKMQKSIVAWLGVGMEPTEHLLNEIMESSEKYKDPELNTILIIKNANQINDATLSKALKIVPNLKILIEKDNYNIDKIYEDFNILDKKLPLALVFNKNSKAIYACAGYNVGIGEMLIKTLKY